MKSLKRILEDVFTDQQTDGETIELPKKNIIVSVFDKQKIINFAPLDKTKPTPQVRTLINQIKQKFKVSDVKQQQGNVFVINLDLEHGWYVL